MSEPQQSSWKALLGLVSKAMLVLAGLSFLAGGRLIQATWSMDRMTAEMLGIGVAVVFGILAAVFHSAPDS